MNARSPKNACMHFNDKHIIEFKRERKVIKGTSEKRRVSAARGRSSPSLRQRHGVHTPADDAVSVPTWGMPRSP